MRKRFNPFQKVNCSRGAPMGRRSGNPDPDAARYCARHQGGADGYDRGGAYWGTPADVWAVWAYGQPDEVAYVRAPCAAAAVQEVTGRPAAALSPIRASEDAADFLATVLWLRNEHARDERPKRYADRRIRTATPPPNRAN